MIQVFVKSHCPALLPAGVKLAWAFICAVLWPVTPD